MYEVGSKNCLMLMDKCHVSYLTFMTLPCCKEPYATDWNHSNIKNSEGGFDVLIKV
jgi:hypothetical protein